MPHLTYQKHHVPTGDAGTKETVRHIAREIQAGTRSPKVRLMALSAIKGCKPKDKMCELKAIFGFLKRNFIFRNDPVGVELIHTADKLTELMTGDCDDATILAGSMLRSVGLPVRIVVIAHRASAPRAFSHIYLQAQNPYTGEWHGFDVSVPTSTFGWEPPAYRRKALVRLGNDGGAFFEEVT